MAYNKRTWLGRQGTGLNKFSIGGATPVTIVNQPDSVTQVGDALSAGNLNDLEDRIEDAFDDVDTELDTKADEQDVTNLNNALTALDHRVQNIEQAKGDYVVQSYKDGSTTPSGKGKWCVVEGVEGVSRVENQMVKNGTFDSTDNWNISSSGATWSVSGNVATISYDTAYRGISQPISFLKGHKYLVRVDLKKVDADAGVQVVISDNSNFTLSISTDNVGTNWTSCEDIVSTDTNVGSSVAIFIRNGSSGYGSAKSVQARNVVLVDLNVYFAGDPSVNVSSLTIADIQRDYPHLLIPSDYGTRIVDWTGNGVRAEGNLIDESSYGLISEISRYGLVADVDEGFFTLSGTAGQSYATGLYVNGNLTDIENVSGSFSRTFNISEPCKLMIWINSSTNYLSNVMLNRGMVADPHCAYMPTQTLSFPSTTLKSAGSVRDTLELNVEVDGVAKKRTTQRVDSVDLGSLTWNYEDATQRFYAILSDAKKASAIGNTVLIGAIQPLPYKRLFTDSEHGYEYMIANIANEDDAFWFYTNVSNQTSIQIKDTTYNSVGSASDPSSFLGHLQGKYLNYELAEESVTLSDPILDNTLLTEAYGRLSTVQTGTVVDGIADLGFITL